MNIMRNNIENLMMELENRKYNIRIENLFKYRRNNIIVKTETINTETNLNRKLTLCDGRTVMVQVV